MTHGSLFSGIGGFDLAAEWMGWENKFHCEWNPFGQKVLHHYWPQAEQFTDITKTNFKKHANKIDVLTGGFPCQPYSTAGKRLGKADDRHLWPHMLRAIKEIQPRWVVGENVLGLVNWSGGLVFHEVQADLEAAGYEVFPYVLPAVSVNAPHRRDRVWFVAYAKHLRLKQCEQQKQSRCGEGIFEGLCNDGVTPNTTSNGCEDRCAETREPIGSSEQGRRQQPSGMGGEWITPNPNRNGQHRSDCQHEIQPSEGREHALRDIEQMGGDAADPVCIGGHKNEWRANGKPNEHDKTCAPGTWQNFPTVPPIRLRDDGVSNKLLRFVVNEFYDTISYTSEKNRIQNLQEVWKHIQQEEIWEQIRGLYSLESKNVLFQTMQLYSSEWNQQGELSPFSEKLCEPIMQHLRKHKEFRCSPQGQELGEQRTEQFGNSLSFLPHEVALAARRFETAVAKFESWHRNESIKAAGNAIVPQVVYQIFKTIQQYENL